MHTKTMNRKAPSKPRQSLATAMLQFFSLNESNKTFNILERPSRPSSVVERVAFNHVVVGSIPTDGGLFSLPALLSVFFNFQANLEHLHQSSNNLFQITGIWRYLNSNFRIIEGVAFALPITLLMQLPYWESHNFLFI